MEFVLGFWLLFAILVAIVAASNGRSALGWFLFSIIFTPILGLILVLIMGRKIEPHEIVSPDTHIICPDCRELIRKDAKICRYCGCHLIPRDDIGPRPLSDLFKRTTAKKT